MWSLSAAQTIMGGYPVSVCIGFAMTILPVNQPRHLSRKGLKLNFIKKSFIITYYYEFKMNIIAKKKGIKVFMGENIVQIERGTVQYVTVKMGSVRVRFG